MTARDIAQEADMTTPDAHEETGLTVPAQRTESLSRPDPDRDETPAGADQRGRGGSPLALLFARVLAAAALLVTALIHANLAADIGLGGPILGRGHLFAAAAVISAVVAVALLARDNWVWLVALVMSVAGLVAILASVYHPIPAVGPFPAIDEPVWLLSKATCAVADLLVISLWLVRQIAPPQRPAARPPVR